jgi:hypothetical protein
LLLRVVNHPTLRSPVVAHIKQFGDSFFTSSRN